MHDLDNYQHKGMQGYGVICKSEKDIESNRSTWKIVIPETLLPNLLKWYHLVLGHCGSQRLYDTVRSRFFAKSLHRACIKETNDCQICQMNKNSTKQYGHLPPRVAG